MFANSSIYAQIVISRTQELSAIVTLQGRYAVDVTSQNLS
uniref:Uncharacterized protein n=1 Tax=Arundo donax TaxID=35708 RepID=A0A0A9H491_ARUDO